MYAWIGLLVFIYSFISSISFSQIPKHLIFGHTFLWGLQSWNFTHMSKGLIYCVHQIQAARIFLFLYFFSFFCLSNWQRLKTCIYKTVSTYLWWLQPGVCELCSLSAIFILEKHSECTRIIISSARIIILSAQNLYRALRLLYWALGLLLNRALSFFIRRSESISSAQMTISSTHRALRFYIERSDHYIERSDYYLERSDYYIVRPDYYIYRLHGLLYRTHGLLYHAHGLLSYVFGLSISECR